MSTSNPTANESTSAPEVLPCYLVKTLHGEDTFYSLLPQSPALDAYLFTHKRRKPGNALVQEMLSYTMRADLTEGDPDWAAIREPLEAAIRWNLDMNNHVYRTTGERVRYGVDAPYGSRSSLFTDKLAAINYFLDDVRGVVVVDPYTESPIDFSFDGKTATIVTIVGELVFNAYDVLGEIRNPNSINPEETLPNTPPDLGMDLLPPEESADFLGNFISSLQNALSILQDLHDDAEALEEEFGDLPPA